MDTRLKLRRVSAPPVFLVDSLLQSDGLGGFAQALAVVPGATDGLVQGFASLPALVLGVASARSTLEATKELADALAVAKRIALAKRVAEYAFALLPQAYVNGATAEITATDLMTLSVVVGLESPGDDEQCVSRLNGWATRVRQVRRQIIPEMGPIASFLGKVVAARAQHLGEIVGLLPRVREFLGPAWASADAPAS